MKAADIMTRGVVSTGPDATIEKAIRLMLQHGISGLPVVDTAGHLIGIVSEGDLLRRAETGTERHRTRWLTFLLGPARLAKEYVRTHGRKVTEVMTCDVVAVTEDAPLNEIVRLMERNRIKRLPVTRDGRVVGIVSRANLLRALVSVVDEVPASSENDGQIRDRLVATLKGQPWAPQVSTNVIVRNAIVHLWGVVFNEEQRQAMIVAAENTPGARSVEDHLAWVEPVSGVMIERPIA
jgi:CBS domain-containing protein